MGKCLPMRAKLPQTMDIGRVKVKPSDIFSYQNLHDTLPRPMADRNRGAPESSKSLRIENG
jgi:hypothetical protein